MLKNSGLETAIASRAVMHRVSPCRMAAYLAMSVWGLGAESVGLKPVSHGYMHVSLKTGMLLTSAVATNADYAQISTLRYL